MIYLSRFRPDPSRSGEFLAALWQGDVPEDLTLHSWLYLEGEPREMMLLWQGDEPARAWVERSFGDFGVLTSEPVTDSTPGLAACLDRDLAAFGEWLRGRGTEPREVDRQLDVRRRGLEASTRDDAIAEGRAWAAEQAARAQPDISGPT